MSDDLDEIWALYADDGGQSLDAAESALATLATMPEDRDAVGLLFRSIHTYKGNSRILGLAVIESVAHVAEDLIGLVRDEGGVLDEDLRNLLLETVDVLRRMMESALHSRHDAEPGTCADLISRMKNKLACCRATTDVRSAKADAGITATCCADNVTEEEFNEALVFGPVGGCLADDPEYREMFLELARSALDDASAALLGGETEVNGRSLKQAIEDIRDAANRIGMPHWAGCAADALAATDDGGDISACLDRLEALYQGNLRHASSPDGSEPTGDRAITSEQAIVPEDVVASFKALLVDFSKVDAEDEASGSTTSSLVATIETWAKFHALASLSDICKEISWSEPGSAEREFALYALGDTLARLTPSSGEKISDVLNQWCSERAPTALNRLAEIARTSSMVDWASSVQLLNQYAAACNHNDWSTPLDAALVLSDLCARIRDSNLPTDTVLSRILVAFSEGALAIIDAKRRDNQFNIGPLEKLLDASARAASSLYSNPSIAELHSRLTIPDSFRDVLSRESTELALSALERGLNFSVIRVDLNDDREITERFVQWVTSERVANIASVTIYEDKATKFDFLIATADTDPTHALRSIDPLGEALSLVAIVPPSALVKGKNTSPSRSFISENRDVPADLSEALGEYAAAYSTLHLTLTDLSDVDICAEGNALIARSDFEALGQVLGTWQERIAKIAQAEAQLSTEFENLQEIAARMRTRPAGQLLQPLANWASEVAEHAGLILEIVTSGHDVAVEAVRLPLLEPIVAKMLEYCVARRIPDTAKFRIDIIASAVNGGVSVEVIDNRPTQHGEADTIHVLSMADAVHEIGGQFLSDFDGGRILLSITLPATSPVVDGMVVRVGSSQYVIPMQAVQRIVNLPRSRIMKISAEPGSGVIDLGDGKTIPVQFFHTVRPSSERSPPSEDISFGLNAGDEERLFVIASTGVGDIALAIDELIGQQIVFVRPLRGYLSEMRHSSGCALLGSGDIGIVVDVGRLAKPAGAQQRRASQDCAWQIDKAA